MCGITGIVNLAAAAPPTEDHLRRMVTMIRHRGPDGWGIYLDEQCGLGHARLSIIDVGGGQQPMSNADGTLWIVFNGEIFNYVELRPQLEARGHRFASHSDTEVLLHMYEEYGPQCLERLNGQFAFAIWNARDGTLFLARDRLGVRPLFYTTVGSRFLFGSEIKALMADPQVPRELDAVTLGQVFSFWSPLSPQTAWRGVVELPPGHYLLARGGQVTVNHYWSVDFSEPAELPSLADTLEEFESLLVDAVKIRLRADVPVGAYLSGGLDSSTIAAVVRNHGQSRLDTFSIAFTDRDFDESVYQRQMAQFLGTDHQVVQATPADIGRVFPEVLWHTEVPLMRTAPAPMFLLSKLVAQAGYKVVLTGEGADEFLAGYDIFKEAKIRRFWAREPSSERRSRLLQRLYPDIANLGNSSPAFLRAFFETGLSDTNQPDYSHAVRWRNNQRTFRFLNDSPTPSAVNYSARFAGWGTLAQSQFLEISIFLSQYLLSAQGDRMAMANAVEGRFPFLDYRVVEFCNRLPARLKLRGLRDKYLLRKLAGKWLPAEIAGRRKRPYRAPIHRSFFHPGQPDYVRELLSEGALKRSGFFKWETVRQLVAKIDSGKSLGETDDMALVGILSTQLVHHQFVTDFKVKEPVLLANQGQVVRRNRSRTGRRRE